jgi:predicted ester cyclase
LFDDVINRWRFDLLDQVFAPSFRVAPDEQGALRGAEAARQFFLWLQSVFPDLQYTIDDVVAEEDKAVARVHARATHRGTYMGHSATGLPVEYDEMVMLRLVEGKIAEWWVQVNQLHVLQQIGGFQGSTTNRG